MNTNVIVTAFAIAVTAIIWVGTTTNNASWTGNRNVCVGECYEAWKSENGGTIADIERVKQEMLAAASPEALGKSYYGQCIACHGGKGEGEAQAHGDVDDDELEHVVEEHDEHGDDEDADAPERHEQQHALDDDKDGRVRKHLQLLVFVPQQPEQRGNNEKDDGAIVEEEG